MESYLIMTFELFRFNLPPAVSPQARVRGGQGPGWGHRPDQAGRELQLPHHRGHAPPQARDPRVSPQRHHLHPGHWPGSLRPGVPGARKYSEQTYEYLDMLIRRQDTGGILHLHFKVSHKSLSELHQIATDNLETRHFQLNIVQTNWDKYLQSRILF